MADFRWVERVIRSPVAGMIALGMSAGLLRLTFAWQYTSDPLGQYPWVDEASYWSWAKALLSTGWWPLRPFYQDPLYPYALACLMRMVGPDVAHLRIASALLGSLTPVLVAIAGRIGLGRAEGWVAGWLTAFYGPLIFVDGSLEKEGLAAILTAASLVLTAIVWNSGRMIPAGIAGAAWGLVGLLRSNALLIGPLAALWVACGGSSQTKKGDRHSWQLAGSMLLGVLIVFAPVAAINTWISHPRELMGTTWQLGPNFYIGNGPGATGTYVAPAFVRAHPSYEASDYAMEAMRRAGRTLSPGQVSNFWLVEGLKQWTVAPLGSIRNLVRKVEFVTHQTEIPDNEDIEFVTIVAAPALRWGFVGFGVVFPLAIIGLGRRPYNRFFWFLCLSTGVGLAGTAVFFVVGRYRVPWVPGLVLLAASGCVELVQRIARADWKGFALLITTLGLPAAVLCWHPMQDPVPARWGNQLVAKAVADLRSGRLDASIDDLDLARACSQPAARRVRELVTEGAFHDLLSETIDRDPSNASGPLESARSIVQRAHYPRQLPESRAQAQGMLESVLQTNADDPDANLEWGMLLLSWAEGTPGRERALKALETASRNSTSDPRATVYLALARSDRTILDRLQAINEPSARVSVRLARAILDSRPSQARTGR